jgi:hypothetical protein
MKESKARAVNESKTGGKDMNAAETRARSCLSSRPCDSKTSSFSAISSLRTFTASIWPLMTARSSLQRPVLICENLTLCRIEYRRNENEGSG